MRIIGGSLKGRYLNIPSRFKARPTTDQARESLFNILEGIADISELEVLDLFAGTGAISLEFNSRGAKAVTAVDISNMSRIIINKVVKDWKLRGIRFVRQDFFKLVKRANQEFDLIFADPPYAHKRFGEIPSLILDSGWLKPGGILILEHGGRIDLEREESVFLKKNYGGVHFNFYR